MHKHRVSDIGMHIAGGFWRSDIVLPPGQGQMVAQEVSSSHLVVLDDTVFRRIVKVFREAGIGRKQAVEVPHFMQERLQAGACPERIRILNTDAKA
jgi:hypothetical protein